MAKFCHTSNRFLVAHGCRSALLRLYFNSSATGRSVAGNKGCQALGGSLQKDNSPPKSIVLYNRYYPYELGGMDDEEYFEYLHQLWRCPDATPVKGYWAVIKCDSGPGRLNPTLLAHLCYHGFILYPGIPNTTAVTQVMDQSYGPFQSAIHMDLQLIIVERHGQAEKSLAMDGWTNYIWWRGSENRVDCWVSFSAWVFPWAEHQSMGKNRSGPTQQEMHAEPKGP